MIQNAKLNNWTPHKTQPPIWSPCLHHSHWFKQALATEIDSKTHHKFSSPHRFNNHDADSATHTDSTHLWNPVTDSTSILELKSSQHLNDHHDTKPMADLPCHGWSTMIQTHCWIFLYLTLQLLAYLYLTLSLLITLLVVLRCWSSCKIWLKILSYCEIVDIVID